LRRCGWSASKQARPQFVSEPGSSLSTKLGSLISVARTGGPGKAASFLYHRLADEYHERRLGIRTRGFLSGSELHHQSPEFGAYLGAPYAALWHCFGQVAIQGDRDALLDIGSGMGRVLVVAATKPFRRVIGVEISPELAERARENLRRARNHLKCGVELDIADARSYSVPDDITVIHIFNPFTGDTLARVVGNIRASLHRKPRPLTIIYGNPAGFEAMFVAEGWFTRRFFRVFYPNIEYAIYDCVAGPPHA
jgi:methyltransferase family protein